MSIHIQSSDLWGAFLFAVVVTLGVVLTRALCAAIEKVTLERMK